MRVLPGNLKICVEGDYSAPDQAKQTRLVAFVVGFNIVRAYDLGIGQGQLDALVGFAAGI